MLGIAEHLLETAELAPEESAALLLQDCKQFLIPRRAEHAELQAAALDSLTDAFNSLELLILLCDDLADRFGIWRGDEAPIGVSESVMRAMHLRLGLLAAGEVLALLRAGYATGAMARWRALHEAAVRIEFLEAVAEQANDVAASYLLHEALRERDRLRAFNGWMRREGPGLKISPDEVFPELPPDEQVTEQYGREFRAEAGWAHTHLLTLSPQYAKKYAKGQVGRGPTIADLSDAIERAPTDAGWLRFLNNEANTAVHASPWGSQPFAGGLAILRAGPDVATVLSTQAGEASACRLKDLALGCLLPHACSSTSDAERVTLLGGVIALAHLTYEAFMDGGRQVGK